LQLVAAAQHTAEQQLAFKPIRSAFWRQRQRPHEDFSQCLTRPIDGGVGRELRLHVGETASDGPFNRRSIDPRGIDGLAARDRRAARRLL
jgi:hypothetical protein